MSESKSDKKTKYDLEEKGKDKKKDEVIQTRKGKHKPSKSAIDLQKQIPKKPKKRNSLDDISKDKSIEEGFSKNVKEKDEDKPKRKDDKHNRKKSTNKNERNISSEPGIDNSESRNNGSLLNSDNPLEEALKALHPVTRVLTTEILIELKQLLEKQDFRMKFLEAGGFDKLSIHLIKKENTPILVHILNLFSDTYSTDQRVFDYLFADNSFLITTFTFIIVKLSDPKITAKVYSIFACIPAVAKKGNHSPSVIQDMLLSALNLYNQKSSEERRFQHLVLTLQHSLNPDLRLAIAQLINQIIDLYENVEARMALRLELSSLQLEDVFMRIYEESSPELKQQIDHYNEVRLSDLKKYSEFHGRLVKHQWLDGHDLNGLTQELTLRWSSSPNLQKIVVNTLCNLLHFPTDESFGASKWLFINKIVSQLASNFKSTIDTQNNVDLKQLLFSVQEEVALKNQLQERIDKIEGLNLKIEKLNNEIKGLQSKLSNVASLENENTQLRSKIEMLNKQITKNVDLEDKLKQENEENKRLETIINEIQGKLEITEKQLKEKLEEEKLLYLKLEELEKAIPTKKPLTTIPDSPEPASVHPFHRLSSAPDLQPFSNPMMKEELRMNKAINRFTSNPTTPAFTRSTSATLRVNNTLNKVASPVKPGSDLIPEWRKRQLEKEREAQEKAEKELLLKQQKLEEAVQNVDNEPSKLVVAGEVSTEKEEFRLSKAMSRSSYRVGQKT